MNQAPHRQQYFPASLPPFPLSSGVGQGKAGEALGSVGSGVEGEESEGERKKKKRQKLEPRREFYRIKKKRRGS